MTAPLASSSRRGFLGLITGRLPSAHAVGHSAPEPKMSAAAPLIALESLGQPVWSPRDYAAFAREGFMQNAIVYRSVRMIAEAAASIPLILYDGLHEIEQHPLLDLVARPNPVSTAPDLLESYYGFLLVSGNAYLEAVAASGRIRELYALRPDRMKVVPDINGWPDAYDYTVAGHTVRYQAEPVPGVRPILHVRLFHPTNDHYGMSPIEAAAVAIDIHNTASRWNKALLDNSARPSGALVYSARDGALSPEQYDRLKRELESGFQGAAQAGRPLLLEGGLDWKAMSLTPKDMDFIEAKHAAAREIALALGVPPMLLAIPGDNTYSNYQEAQRAFWRQTVLPLVNRTAKALSGWLAPAYGDNLVLRPDLDQIPALMSEREQLWTMLDKATFLTPDEKRAAAGYAPADKAGTASNHKFNPHHADNGQFTFAPGGATVQPAAGGRRGPPGNPAQMQRLDGAVRRAEAATRRVRELDPNWQRTPGAHSSDIEGQIADQTARAQEAEARLAELMQGSVPNTNPSWGYQRFRKELLDQGYEFVGPARRGVGEQFTDPVTGETVRIMRRPIGDPWPSDPAGKFYQDYYYRYSYPRSGEFPHVPLPNK